MMANESITDNSNLLSTSPVSVMAPYLTDRCSLTTDKLSLKEFVEVVPTALAELARSDAEKNDDDDEVSSSTTNTRDPVASLLRRLELTPDETARYARAAPDRDYTRNLVASDDRTFSLLLLCWNPERSSPIHDHPCRGCWMRVERGALRERRFVRRDGALALASDETVRAGEMTFIEDRVGYHAVGNEDPTNAAASLHLYAPPFRECRVWRNVRDGDRADVCPATEYYSEYGRVVNRANQKEEE